MVIRYYSRTFRVNKREKEGCCINPHYDVKVISENDHVSLEAQIKLWMQKEKPEKIIHAQLVAGEGENVYCAMFIYQPRSKPLPRDKKRGRDDV